MSPLARALLTVMTVVVCVLLPVVALWAIFANASGKGSITDFEQVFHPAAEAVLDGESPYPPSLDHRSIRDGAAYVYPPLTAIAVIPLTVFSSETAGLVMMALLVLTAAATLLVLGVRDWRCYGIVFVWPPVLSAIQIGTITLLLALGTALAWRFRDRTRSVGLALGLSLAAKVIVWPLLVWLAASRRLAAAALAVLVGAAAVFVSWAAIGFDGLRDYPDLVRRLEELEAPDGYTVYALALDLGAPSGVARGLGLALALGLLAAVVVTARRGDDRSAFVLAIAAALAASPIVWLHYFAFLLVVVAVMQPRLGPAWFAPLLLYASTGTGNGTTLQTAVTIAAAALTIAASLWSGPAPTRAGLTRPRLAERPG